jgi:hypothetical protein
LAALYGAHLSNFPHVLDYKDSANTWFTPYYFSIVTYTTLGLLLSVLAQSIARRS